MKCINHTYRYKLLLNYSYFVFGRSSDVNRASNCWVKQCVDTDLYKKLKIRQHN